MEAIDALARTHAFAHALERALGGARAHNPCCRVVSRGHVASRGRTGARTLSLSRRPRLKGSQALKPTSTAIGPTLEAPHGAKEVGGGPFRATALGLALRGATISPTPEGRAAAAAAIYSRRRAGASIMGRTGATRASAFSGTASPSTTSRQGGPEGRSFGIRSALSAAFRTRRSTGLAGVTRGSVSRKARAVSEGHRGETAP